MDTLLTVRDALNMAVDKAFREAGIVIAFPQRDIHVQSVKDGTIGEVLDKNAVEGEGKGK